MDYLTNYLRQNFTKQQLTKLKDVPLPVLAKNIGRRRLDFFCKYYLPHYFTKPFSSMHMDLFSDIRRLVELKTGGKAARAAPRGSAKSTLIITGQVLWHICYHTKNYILLIKDTGSQAGTDIGALKDELVTNQLLRRDFPEAVGEGKVWKEADIITNNGVRIQGVGSRMKIRGRRHRQYRPDLVILDDIENEENTLTPEQREKLSEWFNKAVMKVGTPNETDYFMIGTILHHDSLLNRILHNPGWLSRKYQAVIDWPSNQQMWDHVKNLYMDLDDPNRLITAQEYYIQNRMKLLDGARVLWPEGADMYFLYTKLWDDGRSSFDSEFQNEPVSLEDATFRRFHFYSLTEDISGDEYRIRVNPETVGQSCYLDECTLYMSCDPSLGKTAKSDYSAIMVGALSPSNRLFTLEADISRRHPDRIIEDIFKHVLYYEGFGLDVNTLAVESVQFQEFFKDQIASMSAKRGLYLNVCSTSDVVVDGRTKRVSISNRNKMLRIQSMQPDIENGYVLLHRNHRRLLEQLRYWPKADHDDGPDALKMLVDVSRSKQWSIA